MPNWLFDTHTDPASIVNKSGNPSTVKVATASLSIGVTGKGVWVGEAEGIGEAEGVGEAGGVDEADGVGEADGSDVIGIGNEAGEGGWQPQRRA